MNRSVEFGGIGLKVPHGWEDTTQEIQSRQKPFTLTKRDGIGALQFTIALYRRGAKPDLSSSTLLSMVEEFGDRHTLGSPSDQVTEDEVLSLAAVSYRNAGEFIRVWYVSDGWNVATITYVCEVGLEEAEIAECEGIVRSIRFQDSRVQI